MVNIRHLGHACFLIDNEEERLIIDQFDDSIGYKVENQVVNYSLISHNHYDHNYTNNLTILNNKGTIKVEKINSYHDHDKGKKRGNNTIHVIETNGVRICHLGDLGHVLEEEQLSKLNNIDVLLIPVGGTYTIDYKEAYEVVKQIKPRVVVPMHYKTDKTNLDIDYVDNFINIIKNDYEVIICDTNSYKYDENDNKKVYVI